MSARKFTTTVEASRVFISIQIKVIMPLLLMIYIVLIVIVAIIVNSSSTHDVGIVTIIVNSIRKSYLHSPES